MFAWSRGVVVIGHRVRSPPTSWDRGYFSHSNIRHSFIILCRIPSLKKSATTPLVWRDFNHWYYRCFGSGFCEVCCVILNVDITSVWQLSCFKLRNGFPNDIQIPLLSNHVSNSHINLLTMSVGDPLSHDERCGPQLKVTPTVQRWISWSSHHHARTDKAFLMKDEKS